MRVLNTHNPASPGTLITREGAERGAGPRSVARKRHVTLVHMTSNRMLGAHGFLSQDSLDYGRHQEEKGRNGRKGIDQGPGVDGPEGPGADPVLHDAAHHLELRHAEGGDPPVGLRAPFQQDLADDHAGQVAPLPQRQDRFPHHAPHLVLEGALPAGVGLEHLPQLGQGVLQGRRQQALLAAEVVVDQRHVAAGPGGHLPDGQLPRRAGGQDGLGRLDEGPAGVALGPTAPAGRRCRCRCRHRRHSTAPPVDGAASFNIC